MPMPDGGTAEHHRELMDRLFSAERDTLIDAFERLRDEVASEEDLKTIHLIYRLAQERFDTGLIIVRERKPPAQWNAEMREALRLQRENGGTWRTIVGYNEFVLEESANNPSH